MTIFANIADLQSALAEIKSVRQTIPWDDDRREQLMKAESLLLTVWKRLEPEPTRTVAPEMEAR